jgi:hypothetical protein
LPGGRIVLAEAGTPEWQMQGLELRTADMYLKIEDTPHAYQYDGCHFGIIMQDHTAYRTLCFYTRADRDTLFQAML